MTYVYEPVEAVFVIRNIESHTLFRKDKMSPNTAVLYLTREAAERAIAQIYRAERYEIVEVPNMVDTKVYRWQN